MDCHLLARRVDLGHEHEKTGGGRKEKKARSVDDTDRAIDLATTYSRGTYRPTTIGCSGLNGRVRDGNGWDPRHIITRKGNPANWRDKCFKFEGNSKRK